MKATKLVTTAALAALGLSVLAPSVLAAPDSLPGSGEITFKEGTDPNPPVDPEDPEEEVDPPGPVNPEGGPLTIDFVGDLKFGTQNITPNEGIYYAAEASTTLKGGGSAIKRGNWVQITDQRAVTAAGELGWNVKAELTEQFTAPVSGSVLSGSTLTYSNPVVTTETDTSGTIGGITPVNNVTLEYVEGGGGSETMVSAEPGHGFGTYSIQYGRAAGFGGLTESTKTSNKSIQLVVPANKPLAKETYTAEITWTIEEL